jgi:hypothetical protein
MNTEVDVHKADTLAPYIGQDFLTWLWFATEQTQGTIQTGKGEVFALFMEQRVSVQGGEGETRDTAVSSGPRSELREARLGLQSGKKVHQARIRLEKDENVWQLQIKAEDFALGSVKTPKVDARFLEKMYLLEVAQEVVDDLFALFLHKRFGPDWAAEKAAIVQWIKA